MIELELARGFQWVAIQCEKHVGPRKFYLHNRIGGEGWDVRPVNSDRGRSIVRLDDPKMATYILLKTK